MDNYPTPRRGLTLDELDMVRSESERIIRHRVDTLRRSDWHDGMTWYLDAHNWSRAVAHNYGLDPSQVAWVIALLSPQNHWAQNRIDTIDLIEHGICGALPLGVERSLWVLQGTNGESIAGGRKVRSFGRNIAYPHSSYDVTLDGHMCNVLDLPSPRYLERRGIYDTLSDSFRAVARDHGLLPHQLQASLWIGTRGYR